jgi:hypothetical protein
MLNFEDCLLIAVGAIHQASVEDTVPHGEGVTQLMIYHFDQEINVQLTLILHSLLSFAAIAMLNDLFERN